MSSPQAQCWSIYVVNILSLNVVVVRVILVGLVMGGYNPMPDFKSRKCLTLFCDSCCNKSMLTSPQTNIVLLLRSLFKMGSILSHNLYTACQHIILLMLISTATHSRI